MRGDFTRGHRPDGKRSQRYTRGLLQQRRLLLDSDVNAMTDALHERLRDLASDLGCPHGSPDLGYLVTPGRLLAVFEELADVRIESGNVTIYRDYSRKYLDRFPSLYLEADAAGAGSVSVRLRHPSDGDVRLSARAEVATSVDVAGNSVAVPAHDAFQPLDFNTGGSLEELVIELDAGEAIWLGLIEELQAADSLPRLSVAAGRFYLAGLPLTLSEDTLYPDGFFPVQPAELLAAPLPDLADGDRLLAFAEGWERHVTSVEDPGLLEQALGNSVDTTTRGQALGQVKLVRVPGGPLDVPTLANAIHNPLPATGTLEVTTPPAPPDPDPCALPLEDGYSGPDNRLYYFEVHERGDLGDAVLKWSRDNGSELYAAVAAPADNRLVFAARSGLRAGDLVEVLNDAVDLGDQFAAELLAPDQFQRPERAVGQLAILETAAGAPPASGIAFVLRRVDGTGDVNLDGDIFGPFPNPPPIKVRRWHGLIPTTAGTTEYQLEHGIVLELNGRFSVGDYWQYEARVDGDNDNGPPVLTPHGPLRAFAPLALLEFAGDTEPLTLVQWLDDRFNPICELNADDLPFDGDRVGADDCDTVQEALECLFERESGGCCEYTLRPNDDDTAERIRDILQESDGEVTICFSPGIYPFRTTLEIVSRTVVLKGCPRAILEAGETADPMFHLHTDARLLLEELVLFAPSNLAHETLIALDRDAQGLTAEATGFIHGRVSDTQSAIRVGGLVPSLVNPSDPIPVEDVVPEEGDWPDIGLQECVFVGSWMLAAWQLSALRLHDCVGYCFTGGVFARVVGNLEMRDVAIGLSRNLDFVTEWDADGLLTDSAGLLDSLPPVGSLNAFDLADSVAVRIGLLMRGSVESCLFSAGYGILITEAHYTQFRSNVYQVSRWGVGFQVVRGVRIDGERVRSGGDGAQVGIGILLQVQPVAGSKQLGSGLTLTGSFVDGFEVGLALATASDTGMFHLLAGVRVSENQISASRIGVQVGPDNFDDYAGDVSGVSVADNEIRSLEIGVAGNSRSFSGDNSNPLNRIRICSNSILAVRGIFVTGSRFELVDNVVEMASFAELCFGIEAIFADEVWIAGNAVERPSVTTVSESSTAYVVRGGRDARISHNISRSGQPITGLEAESHRQLRVDGNEFGTGYVRLSRTDGLVFQGNRAHGTVTIVGSQSGTIVDNRLETSNDNYVGSLIVAEAGGSWQISGNHVADAINFTPRFDRHFVVRPGLTGLPVYTWEEATGLHELAERSGVDAFAADIASADTPLPPGLAILQPTSELPLALRDPDWPDVWRNAVEGYLSNAMVDAVPNLPVDDLVARELEITEHSYEGLIEGNLCSRLFVGFRGERVIVSSATIMLVNGNRAVVELFVGDYRRRVVSDNISSLYSGVGVVFQNAAIVNPNLDT